MDEEETKSNEVTKETASKEESQDKGTEASTSSDTSKNRQRRTDARRRLQELEENVVAKTRLDAPRATEPGAFAAVGGRGPSFDLSGSKLEQDARTKRRLRRGHSHPNPSSGAHGALTRLENDVMTKTRSGQSGASVPGAVSSTGGSQFSKSASDSRVGSSRTSDTRTRLRDLESQTLAKSRARAGRASGTTVNPVARKMAAESGSGTASAVSSIRELERDVLSKSILRSRSTPRNGSRFTLDSVEEESPSSEHFLDVESRESYEDEPLSEYHDDPGASTDLGSPSSVESRYSDRSLGRAHTARVSPVEPPGGDVGSDTNALEAFVADTVVDATGVAIVLSDEDEKELLKRQSRRFMFRGCILFVIITIAVVVPLVVLLDGSGSDEPVELDPTANVSVAPSPSPSLQPTTSGISATIDFLTSNSISKLEALQDRDSPQYLAMEWVSDIDSLNLDFSDPAQEDQWLQRYLLAVLYFATGGDSWSECSRGSPGCATSGSSWLTEDDECEWLAVLCDSSKTVNGITFLRARGNNLVGELPDEFFLMTNLRALVLQHNSLKGTLSDSWGNLSNLVQLVLTGNEFSGRLPQLFLEKAEKLGRLLLGQNAFEGEIPRVLAQLPLTQLRLDENLLNSTIPDELFDVTTLQELKLSRNFFTGPLSARFGDLTALKDLQLQDNEFTGPVPDQFGLLVQLETLNLHGNMLSGSISAETCQINFRELTADCNEVGCSCCTRCF